MLRSAIVVLAICFVIHILGVYMDSALRQIRTSQFIRHNAVYFVGSVLVSGLNYLYYPVLGRMLKPAVFGEVQTLIALFTQAAIFLSILGYIIIHVTVNEGDEQRRNQILHGLEYIALLAGGGLLLVALVLVPVVQNFLHFDEIWPFLGVIAALGVSIPLSFRIAYLRGRKQFAKASMIDGAGSASKLLFSPVFVLLGLGSFGAIIGLALSQVVSLLLGMVWAYRLGLHFWARKPKRVNYGILIPQARHGAAVLAVSVCAIAVQTAGVIAIKHYFAPEAAGHYAGMATVASIVFFVAAPVIGVMVSLVGINQPRRRNQLRLYGSLLLVGMLGGSALVVMALMPRLLIRLLIGGEYLAYAAYLPIVGLTMFLLAFVDLLLMYHIALKHYAYCFTALVGMTGLVSWLYISHDSIQRVIWNILLATAVLLAAVIGQTVITKAPTAQEGVS